MTVSTYLLYNVTSVQLCGWVASGENCNTRMKTSHAGPGILRRRRHSTSLGRVHRVNSDEFASRHAWTPPHDAYSAYPASEVILHALGIYIDIFGIPAEVSPLPLPPSMFTGPPRRMREHAMKRRRGEANLVLIVASKKQLKKPKEHGATAMR